VSSLYTVNPAEGAAHEGARHCEQIVDQAVSRAIDRYIAARENRIGCFVRRHYSFRGSLRLHSHAVGWDLVRVPLNITWSVARLVLYLLGQLARLAGFAGVATALNRVPCGLTTNLDRQVGWLVVTELLELPHRDGVRESRKDALMDEILKDPALGHLIDARLQAAALQQQDPAFRRQLELKLAEYGSSRTGTAEFASNFMVLLSSKLALGQASFGSLSAGSAVAALVAKYAAVSSFWMGPVAGSYFYALVPVTPSLPTLLAVIAGMVLLMACVSTFIGILTDPLQARFGLHRRRLRKLLQAVRQDLSRGQGAEFQLREKYVGRVFDVLDYLTLLGRSG
jgi:hypothetical protein